MRRARTTIRRVNEALAAAGFRGVELVRGNGYFYFSGDTAHWHTTAVYTDRLTGMTVEQWVDEARRLREGERW